MFPDIFETTSAELFADPTPVQQKPKKKKNKKKDFKEIMKSAPEAPFKCKTHTSIKLRLRETTKSLPTCKSCGFKCEGESGYLSCPESSSCYVICSACRVCPRNHILRHCVSLKQYEADALYAENKFKCSSCEKEKKVEKDGVYHCGPCSFSICMECMSGLDSLWEAAMERREEGLEPIKEEIENVD